MRRIGLEPLRPLRAPLHGHVPFDGFDTGRKHVETPADEEQIAARDRGARAPLGELAEGGESSHLEVVRKRRSLKAQDLAQVRLRPRRRERSRHPVVRGGMRNHDRPRVRHERVEGRDVQGELVRIRLDHRQFLVGVEPGAAEPREVLETSSDAPRVESRQKVPRGRDDGARVRRGAALAENHGAGARHGTVHDRGEVHVEAEAREGLPGELPRPACGAGARGPREGGRRGQKFAQAVDRSAFLVQKEVSRPELPQARR